MISLKWIIVIGVTPQWFLIPICTDSNPTGNTHQHRVVLSIFFLLERNCFNMHFIANEVEYFFMYLLIICFASVSCLYPLLILVS